MIKFSKIGHLILNFIAPEYCLVKNIPVHNKTSIDFFSQEFFDSIQYSISTKEIMIRLLNKFDKDEIHIEMANALLDIKKNEDYRIILHNIKYKSMQQTGIKMGRLLGDKLINDGMTEYDFICPVPVHKIRRRERGYNQSELIGQGVADVLKIDFVPDLLKRKNYGISQTKLSASERLENVKKSFVMNNKFNVKNKKVLIIDDILTTGSTLNNCAFVLMNEGAARTDVSTLALA